jgi:hypothetical protein
MMQWGYIWELNLTVKLKGVTAVRMCTEPTYVVVLIDWEGEVMGR